MKSIQYVDEGLIGLLGDIKIGELSNTKLYGSLRTPKTLHNTIE